LEFCEQRLHELLSFDNPQTLDSICSLLSPLFKHCPSHFHHNYETRFTQLIHAKPGNALRLLGIYADRFDEIEDPWPLLDLLVTQRRWWFRGSDGSLFIDIILSLLQTYPTFQESRFDCCRKLLVEFLGSKDLNTVISAYTAITLLYDNEFDLDFVLLHKHLTTSDLVGPVIGLLSKIEELPIIPELILPILRAAKHLHEATELILRLITTARTAHLLMEHAEFVQWSLPTYFDTFRIVFKVSKFVDVSNCEFIPVLFALAAEVGSPDIYQCFERFLKRVETPSGFLRALQEERFFEHFLSGLIELTDDTALVSGLTTLEKFAEIGFVRDFRTLCKPIKRFLRRGDEVASAALFALRALTQHAEMATALLGKGFEDCLARFDTGDERRAAREIRANLRNAE
jgi:hypothetical protein